MSSSTMVLHEEDFKKISEICNLLVSESHAKLVFLVDKNGQLIAAAGDTENLDTTSLASLAAGNIAATGGLAKLIGEDEFSILFHEGLRDNLHISLVSKKLILVVVFDNRSTVGLVRLRVKKATLGLSEILVEIEKKSADTSGGLFAEITDDDIDNLFND